MATSNFGDVNTLHTYAFGFCEYDNNNTPNECETDFSIKCTIENVCEDLEQYGWETYANGDSVADRCFCATFGGVTFSFSFLLTVRYGYYDGAYFDLSGTFTIDTPESSCAVEYDLFPNTWSEKDASIVSDDDWTGRPGLNALQGCNLMRFLARTINEVRTGVERILGKYTTPLNCVGRYNNGSALYERAS